LPNPWSRDRRVQKRARGPTGDGIYCVCFQICSALHLLITFDSSAKPFPIKAEILQVKAGLMQVDEPPLSNKTNQPTPPSPLKKQKRKRGVGQQKEN
jgi:hypothetical protein